MERPMTDAPVSGREFDLRAGETLAPTIVFVTYGVVKFFTLGTSVTHWPDTYLALAGGIASWLAVLLWGVVVWRKRSLFRTLCALAAYVPMLYSIYAITYLGVYGVYYSIIDSFSVLGILFGLVCIGLGYRMANGLAALTGLKHRTP
jgi:hypothetical protein